MAAGTVFFLTVVSALCLLLGVAAYVLYRKYIAAGNYKLLVDSAAAEYVIFDLLKDKVHGSTGVSRYFGVPANQLTSLSGLSVYIEEGEDEFSSSVELLLQGKKTSISSVIGIEGYTLEVSAHTVENKWGEIVSIICWLNDVSHYERHSKQIDRVHTLLERQKRVLEDMCTLLPFALWCKDSSGDVTYSNALFQELVLPNDSILEKLSSKTQRKHEQYVVVDGKRRHFQFNEIAFPDDSGYFGYAVEQTDLKEIAKELKQSERANSELLNSSSSAMAIYGKDMRLNHYNTAFVDLWSLEEKWLDNKPTYLEVLELLRQERKMPEQADYNKFRNEQISLFKDLIEPRDEYYYLPDGKTLRVIAVPHAQGGVLFAYEDLTDRLSMERSYNTLIAVQKETLDNLSEAVITLGEDGNVQLYNPKYVELWPDSERLLRKNPHVSELIEHSKELLEKDGQEWDKTKERFVSQSTERILTTIRIERTDGKLIDRTAIPLPDGATLISYVDVTDSTLLERSLRERNEALEGADRIKTDFLASVSYELRTPLTSILGLTEILEKQFFGKLNEQQGGYVKDIQVASSELLVLINDVLDMASIEAGYLSLDKADCDIKRLLESLADTLEEKSKEKELKLTIECEGGIGLIKADRRRLKQAILNIFNNVFKFSVQGGHLQVRAYSNNDSVVIMIKDEHVESSDKELAQILKRFHRVMGEKSGSGLGLAVAKNIVELHQGSISLEAAGKGVAVCCKFQPIHKKSTSEAA